MTHKKGSSYTKKGTRKRSYPVKVKITTPQKQVEKKSDELIKRTVRRFPIEKIKVHKEEIFELKTLRSYFRTGKTEGTGIYPSDERTFHFFKELPIKDWSPILISDKFELIDGFHRLAIAQMRRLKTIPVQILNKNGSSKYYIRR